MLVGKRDQKYIISDGNYRERLMMYYNNVIECANNLQKYGNYAHGMFNLSYFLKHNNTILHLCCDDTELKINAYNMAVVGNSLYLGAYKQSEIIQKLKEIIKDCEDMKNKIIKK